MIGVSIVCIVFNHEQYLRDTLNSFVQQITDFEFEIIINDDASTDNSRRIIEEYCERYPGLFRPIFHKENQYSKGVSIAKEFLIPRIRGKYVAICEGDDYWTDNKKLQKQYDFMEKNKNCHMCAHNVKIVEKDKEIGTFPSKTIKTGCYFPQESLLFGYIQTSSYFFKAIDYCNQIQFYEKVNSKSFKGSESLLLYFKSLGEFGFINETMSCYRYNTLNSWSSKHKTIEKRINEEKRCIEMFNAFNIATDNAFFSILETKILLKEFMVLYYKKEFKKLKDKRYKHIRKSFSFKLRFAIWLLPLLPSRFSNYIYKKISI